jgi:cyclopropane fatty-acyl-phospholipid synthase-like methyltransferase
MAAVDGVLAAFSATAQDYNTERRKLIPHFDLLYGAARDLIREWGGPPQPRVLDLGAGTGLMAAMVLEELPAANLLLLDGSNAMLTEARARFASHASVRFALADMADAALGDGWDLVVSSLAIHHLDDAKKRQLFGRVQNALVPGGLFINVEQVCGPDPESDGRYARFWHRDISESGATVAQIAAASDRMKFDRCATVEDQLRWMRDAGFANVDCSVKAWRFAVLSGRRAA